MPAWVVPLAVDTLELRFPCSPMFSYRAQGIDHVRHGGIGVTLFFLDGSIPNVELELRRWVTLCLSTTRRLAGCPIHC